MALRLARALAAFLLVVGGALYGLWVYTKAPPGWYAPPDVADERVQEVADLVESRVLEEVHKIRAAPTPWSLRVRDEHVNAWLASKLRDWVEYEQGMEWPRAVGTPQIRFRPGAVEVAADVETPDGVRVLVARLIPFVTRGELRITLDRVMIGRLPIPGSAIETLREHIPADALADYEGWLTGERAVPLEIGLSDDRKVQVTAARCDTGILELTCETVR